MSEEETNIYFNSLNKSFDEIIKEHKQLRTENEFLKLSNPEQNIRHWEVINENRRKIGNLRKQNKELKEQNKELELIVGLRQKRNLISKFDKEYDKEDKEKNPNRDYACVIPDAEVVYQRYYKQKEVIEEVREYIKSKIKEGINPDGIGEPFLELGCYEIRDLLQILDKAKGE